MEKLTTEINDSVYYVKGKYGPSTLCAEMETWEVRECMKKLAAYERTGLEPEEIPTKDLLDEIDKKLGNYYTYRALELQELLFKLPCKVGDTVWYMQEQYRGKTIVKPCTVSTIQIDRWIRIYGIEEKQNTQIFYANDFGKTVFLTREEAEKALEKQNE